jgi:hypothetical protein
MNNALYVFSATYFISALLILLGFLLGDRDMEWEIRELEIAFTTLIRCEIQDESTTILYLIDYFR